MTDRLAQALELTLQAEALVDGEAEPVEEAGDESLSRAVDTLRIAIGALQLAIEERAKAV